MVVLKEIMDADLNSAAICLYLFHDPGEQVLRGSMDSRMLSRKEYVLIRPLPLMSKGESDFGVVAIKSKGGDCRYYDACVVLDGNPLIEEHLTYIQLDESTEEINRETDQRSIEKEWRTQPSEQ